ncbi:unannotated protein [freshwater metagenome]|uniref:Unannotated protein n=1 Tax=freshwater metagenome TaxID=449393 RepID=A0A6J7RVE7_9ZZZZ|nr:hypothetical protein [Actinomycetota bacterium]MTB24287.1 hypothetical protein [Actinomycetota bacterium]
MSSSSARSAKRRLLERLWVIVVIAYGAGRAIVVWKALGQYGVNPWIYLALDVTSSWPYAVATARLVTSVIDREFSRAKSWGLLAAVTFLIPDLYILAVARDVPTEVYAIIIAIISLLALLAILSLIIKIRNERRARNE